MIKTNNQLNKKVVIKKRVSVRLKNRNKVFFGLLLLSSMLFLNVQSISSSDVTEPVLEDLTTNRILEFYQVDNNGNGGFTDGSTSSVNWYDTLDALEGLSIISYNLSLAQRRNIAKYVMNERATETRYDTQNVTVEKEVEFFNNDTQKLEIHNITEFIPELVPYEKTITWWNGVKKSVQALRILQLVDQLNQSTIDKVKNRILHHFDDTGLNWNLGQPGWEDTYWGFYKTMEYDLFNLMPELGLLPLSPSTLSYLEGQDIEISENVLFSTNVPINWISAQHRFQDEIILSTNPLNDFTHISLSIPRFNEIFPSTFVTNYIPTLSVIVDWSAIRNDSRLLIDNYESRAFALENNLITNETVYEDVIVTHNDGIYENKTITTTEETWYHNDLHYQIQLQVVSDEGDIIFETNSRLNEPSLTQVTIPLGYLDRNNRYSLLLNPYQQIHSWVEVFNTSTLEFNTSKAIEEFKESVLGNNESQVVIEGQSFTGDELSLVDETNTTLTVEYLADALWDVTEQKVEVPVTIHMEIPQYGLFTYSHSEDGATAFASVASNATYGMLVWRSSGQDWNTMFNESKLLPLVLMNGLSSTGASDAGTYMILLTPDKDTPIENLQLDSSICVEARETVYHYHNEYSVRTYLPLFNQTSPDLNLILEQLNVINSLTFGVSPFDFVKKESVLESIFYHYNSSSLMFEDDPVTSLETWKVLDRLKVSKEYLNRDNYNQTLVKMIQDNYHEEYENSIVTKIMIYGKDNPISELKTTREFLELLNYQSDWKTQVPTRKDPTMEFNHVGIAVRVTETAPDPTGVIFKAQEAISTELYDPEQVELLNELLNPLLNDEAIHISESNLLSKSFMFWLTESPQVDPLDVFMGTVLSLGITVFFMGSVLDYDRKTTSILSALLVLGVMVGQGWIAPIIMNNGSPLISKYIKFSNTLIGMLEDGLYNVSATVQHEIGVLLRDPTAYGTDLIQRVTGGTQNVGVEQLVPEGNSTKELYKEYLGNYRIAKRRQEAFLVSHAHQTINYWRYEPPLTYQEYLKQIAQAHFNAMYQKEITKQQRTQQRDSSRLEQRQNMFTHILSKLNEGVTLSDNLFNVVGTRFMRESDELVTTLTQGTKQGWKSYINKLQNILTDELDTGKWTVDELAQFDELLNAVKKMKQNPDDVFNVVWDVGRKTEVFGNRYSVLHFYNDLDGEWKYVHKTLTSLELPVSVRKYMYRGFSSLLADVEFDKTIGYLSRSADEAVECLALSDEGITITREWRGKDNVLVSDSSYIDHIEITKHFSRLINDLSYEQAQSLRIYLTKFNPPKGKTSFTIKLQQVTKEGFSTKLYEYPMTEISNLISKLDNKIGFGYALEDIAKISFEGKSLKETVNLANKFKAIKNAKKDVKSLIDSFSTSEKLVFQNLLDNTRYIGTQWFDDIYEDVYKYVVESIIDSERDLLRTLNYESVRNFFKNGGFFYPSSSAPDEAFEFLKMLKNTKTTNVRLVDLGEVWKRIVSKYHMYAYPLEQVTNVEFMKIVDEVVADGFVEIVPLGRPLDYLTGNDLQKIINSSAAWSHETSNNANRVITSILMERGKYNKNFEVLQRFEKLNVLPKKYVDDLEKGARQIVPFHNPSLDQNLIGRPDILLLSSPGSDSRLTTDFMIEVASIEKTKIGAGYKFWDPSAKNTLLADSTRVLSYQAGDVPATTGILRLHPKELEITMMYCPDSVKTLLKQERLAFSYDFFRSGTKETVEAAWKKKTPLIKMNQTKMSQINAIRQKLRHVLNRDIPADFVDEVLDGGKKHTLQDLYSLSQKDNYRALNKYFDLISKSIIDTSSSPLTTNLELGMYWNLVGYSTDQELETLATMSVIQSLINNGFIIDEITTNTQGYFAGDVGGGTSATFISNEGETNKRINCSFPSWLDDLNTVTTGAYKFDGVLVDGIKFDLDATDPYEGEPYSEIGGSGVFVHSAGGGRDGTNWTGDFAIIGRPGLEQLTGFTEINLVDTPYFNWTWKNDPYEATEGDEWTDAGYLENHDWATEEWNQGQITFLVSDGSNSEWIGVMSTSDTTPETSLWVGYAPDIPGRQYLEPIIWLDKTGDSENDFEYSIVAPFVPEEVNLLSLARAAGLTGDQIMVQQIAMGIGNVTIVDSDHRDSHLYITDMKFLDKNDSAIDAWGQGALKSIYDVQSVAMGSDWDAIDSYLETNKGTYDQLAFEMATGVSNGDNGNAYDWVLDAKVADLHDEFRYFYSSGIVVLKNSSETDSPVRGVFAKTKQWPLTTETLSAPLYTSTDLDQRPEVMIYLDPIYDNGWDRALWLASAVSLQDGFASAGFNTQLLDADQLAEYMHTGNPQGLVILLGALPETIWGYQNSRMMPDDMTSTEWGDMTEDYSVLEYYLEHGGMVLSTGQFGGGWNVAFYDAIEQETTIGNYDSTTNPLGTSGTDLNVDIGEILYDKSFVDNGYVPSSASRMVTSTGDDFYPDIGNYYSLGLRYLSGDIVQTIADDGGTPTYADSIWLVKQAGQSALDVDDGTGLFINFHTAEDNSSAGAITETNLASWIEDIIELITGADIPYSVSYGSDDFASTVVSKDRLYPASDSTNGRLGSTYYWNDTFINGTSEGWSDVTQSRLHMDDSATGWNVGSMFSDPNYYLNTTKDIDLVSVADYPYLTTSFYDDNKATIIESYDYSEAFDWTGSESYDLANGNDEIIFEDDGSPPNDTSHQFYYKWLHDETVDQTGEKDISPDLDVDINTMMNFAVNPVYLESYEFPASETVSEEEQWDDYDHASEWWLELEIDDGSGSNKKIRYFFTLQTPIWYKGVQVVPDTGYIDDEYYYYSSGWQTKQRTNDNYDGIRWVPIGVSADFDVNRISDGTFNGENTKWETAGYSGWTQVTRNVLVDYNLLFGQAADEVTVTKVRHCGHFIAGEGYVLLDDFVFYTIDNGKQYAMKTSLTDGQYNVNIINAASTSDSFDILPLEDDSLELYLKLNDGSGTQTYDSSLNDHIITENSWDTDDWNPSSYDEQAGSTYHFDGQYDHLTLDTNPDLTDDLTFVAWVRRDGTGQEFILDARDANDDGVLFQLRSDNKVELQYNDVDTTSTSIIDDTNWHMVVAVIDKTTDSVQLYIDGVANGSVGDITSKTISVTTALRIGARSHTSADYHFDGYLDDVAVFSRALSSDEVADFYQTSGRRMMGEVWQNHEGEYYYLTGSSYINPDGSNLNNVDNDGWITVGGDILSQATVFTPYLSSDLSMDGLEAYINFNDGSGTTASDSSINGNDFTLSTSTQWSSDSYSAIAGGSFYPNRAGSYYATHSTLLDTVPAQGTMSIWFKNDDATTGVTEYIFSKGNVKTGGEPGEDCFYLRYNPSGVLWVNRYNNTAYGKWLLGISPELWNMLTVTWDGTTRDVYLNGVAIDSVRCPGLMQDAGTGVRDLHIGSYPSGGSVWDGHVDDFTLFNRALSADEIDKLYNQTRHFDAANLYYTDEVALSSWTTGTLIDDIRLISSGVSSALPTDSNDSANYCFNGNGLALKVDTTHSGDGVTKYFDSDYLIRDYNTLSFDMMVTTLYGSTSNPDKPSVVITDGSDVFRAELSPFSTEDDDYYHYGGVKTINKWYHFNLNLMAFSDSDGDCPDDQSVFDELQFFSTCLNGGTFYLDNVILAGSKGTLLIDDFEDVSYHASYGDPVLGVLAESVVKDIWSDDADPADVTVTIVGEHTFLANSPILIDIQEITNVMAVVQGDESETLTLRLYAYKEDGIKITSGTNYLDVITTTDVLQGWDESITRVSDISSLHSETRFLGCPEVIAATGRFAITYLGVVDRDLEGISLDSLETYLKFNEGSGSTAFDTSGNDNDGTLAGDAFWTNDGKSKSAIDFDGADDYVTLGDLDAFDAPGYFTVSLWFNRDSDIGNATNHDVENVLLAQSSGGSNDNLEIGTDGSNIDIYIDSDDGKDGIFSPDAGIQDDVWYHLVLTYDKDVTNEAKLYLDGALINEWPDWTGILDSSAGSPLSLGIARPADSDWGDFDGIIDEAMLFSRALSSEEINDLYSSYRVVMDDAISGYPGFVDDFNYANVNDWSLAVSDNASFSFTSDGTLAFDGGDSSWAWLASPSAIQTDYFEITFRTKVTTNDYTGWELGTGSDKYRCWLDIDDSTLPKVDVVTVGSTAGDLIRNVELTTDIADDEWVVFKIRREGSQWLMWINGQQVMNLMNNSYTAPYDFGFSVYHPSVAEFDNLVITPLGGYDLTSLSPDILTSSYIREAPIASWDLTTKYLDPNDDPDTGSPAEVLWLYDTSINGTQHNSKTITATYDADEGCFDFERSSSQKVTFSDSDAFSFTGDSPFTISTWFKVESINTAMVIASKDDGAGGNREWDLSLTDSGKPAFTLFSDSSTYISRRYNTVVATDVFYHLVGVYDGSESTTGLCLYLDGVRVDDTDATSGTYSGMTNGSADVWLGGNGYGNYFDGLISSVQIFDYDLSHEEVLSLYQPGTSLIEQDDTATINSPTATDDWALSSAFNVTDATEGDLLTATIGGEDLTITAGEIDGRLSFDVVMGESGGFSQDVELFWKLDETSGTTAYDETSNDYDGTNTNAIVNQSGHDGTAYSFNGSTAYVEIPGTDSNAPNLDITGSITLLAWVYPTSYSYWDTIVAKSRSGTGYRMAFYSSNNLIIDFKVGGTRYTNSTASDTVPLNTWTHVGVTYDTDNDEIKLFINGSQSGSTINTASGSLNDNSVDFTIGDWEDHTTERMFNGKIDEVIVFSEPLSSTEIDDIYDNGLTACSSLDDPLLYSDESSLQLSLPLTDEEGTTVNDYSVYDNDGTVTGATLTRSTGVYFDGSTSDYGTLPTAVTDGLQDFTISFWVNSVDLAKEYNFVLHGTDTGSNDLGIALTSSNIYVWFAGGSESEGHTFSEDIWYHISVVRSGSTLYYYVDGVADNSDACDGNALDTDGAVIIGQDQDSIGGGFDADQALEGYLRSLMIWDRAFSADEITGLANTFTSRAGDYGSAVPISIHPLNDTSDRIAVTIGPETMYITNQGTDSKLDSVVIDDISTEGLAISPVVVSNNEPGYLVNADGSISSVNAYASNIDDYDQSYGTIIGDLDSATDALGIDIEDISHTTGKHLIMNITLCASVEDLSSATLYIKPDKTSTGYNWSITDVIDYNPAEKVANGQWVTLQVNTHDLDQSSKSLTDLRVYLYGATGESSLSIGRVQVIEVADLNDTSIDTLLPYGFDSSVSSQGHSVSMVGSTLVLEDNGHDGSDSDFSYVDIPITGATLTNDTHVSFDWYIGVQDPTSAIIVAGVALGSASSNYVNEAVGGDGTPSIGSQSDYETGLAAAEAWLDANPDESEVYWKYYYYVWNYCRTYRPSYMVVTLGDGDNTSDVGINTIVEDGTDHYTNDWDNDGKVDWYNQWVHTDISLSEYAGVMPSTWQNNIRVFIDGNASGKKFQLRVANLQVYASRPAIISLVGQRIGEKNTTDFYVEDWLASPYYPNYDEEERLPKSNLIVNPGFENGDNVLGDPNGWSATNASSYRASESVNVHSGTYAATMSTSSQLIQSIDVGTVKANDVLVSLWYKGDCANSSVKFNAGSANYLTDVSEWTYWQMIFSLDDSDLFYPISVARGSTGDDIYIDDVRVEPSGWTGDDGTYKHLSSYRVFEPLNITSQTFMDGWYAITNVDGSHYIHSADSTAPTLTIEDGYTQYYYTGLWVDSSVPGGDSDDNWQISITEPTASDNIYALWVNDNFIEIEDLTLTHGSLTLYSGYNSIVVMQNVEDDDAWDTSYFRLELERSSWTGYSVHTVRPQTQLARSPVVYYDSQRETKWITRDGSASDLVLDLPLGEGAGSRPIDHSFNDSGEATATNTNWDDYELDFNMTESRVDCGTNVGDLLDGSYGLTVSGWFNLDTVTADDGLFAIRLSGDGDWFWNIRSGGSYFWIGYDTSGGGASYRQISNPFSDEVGNWVHLATTYSSGHLRTYKNGVEIDDYTGVTGYVDISTDAITYIGTYASPTTNACDGRIKDFKIYSRELTSDEIYSAALGTVPSLDVVDTPAMIASSVTSNLSALDMPAQVVNSQRLRYYVDAEVNMDSDGLSYADEETANYDQDGSPLPPQHWGTPYLSPMYDDISEGIAAAEDYLNDHPEASEVYWTYEWYEAPWYKQQEHKTSCDWDVAYGTKVVWHPFGSILTTTDVLPNDVFDSSDNTLIEDYLEMGGKLIWSGGYIPFSYYSNAIGYAPSATSSGGSYDYDGARGHQRVLDLDSLNNGSGYGSRDDFSSGMFLSDVTDDAYNGADTDNDDVIDDYLPVDEDTPPKGGTGENLDDFNYEPISVANGIWTQLPHTGYGSHMVITRHEYDVQLHQYMDGNDIINSVYVYNADGESDDGSNEFSHEEPDNLHVHYYHEHDPNFPQETDIPDEVYDEHLIDPMDANLWFKPYLGDINGAYEVKPEGYMDGTYDSPVGYYGFYSGGSYYFSHFERANVGTGLIQAGRNAKGMVGIMPMFDWSDELNGLHVNAGQDSTDNRGKWEDRGKGSITNSPTTELMARRFATNTTGSCMVNMLLDSVFVNVCRDNSTSGTNFLNLGHENGLGWEPEQYGDPGDPWDDGQVSTDAQYGPITVSTFSDANLSGGTADESWDDYMVAQSNYGLFGDSYQKAVANYSFKENGVTGVAGPWTYQVYPNEKDNQGEVPQGCNLMDYDLQEAVPCWDNYNTIINIDNEFPASASTDAAKFLTFNNLNVDANTSHADYQPDLYTIVNGVYHGDTSTYGSWVDDVDTSSLSRGYNLGVDHSNGDTPDSTKLAGYEWADDYDNEENAKDRGWSIYNTSQTDYWQNDSLTSDIYRSGDTELLLRNSQKLREDQYSETGGNGVYFQPIGILDNDEKASLTFVSGGGLLWPEYLVDGNKSSSWILEEGDFDLDTEGYYNDSQTDDNYVHAQISADEVQVNSIVVYLYDGDLQSYEYDSIGLVRVILEDASNNPVFSVTDKFPEFSKVDTVPYDNNPDSWVAPQPMYISIPEGIEAKYVRFEVWSLLNRDSGGDSNAWVAELEVYKGTDPDTEIYGYTDTEFISRLPELDDDQASFVRFDNGDDQWNDPEDEYFSRPRQSGQAQITMGVSKNDSNNQAMRYNFYYNVPITVQTQQASYLSGNQEEPDFLDFLFNLPEEFIILMVAVLIINWLALHLTAGTSYYTAIQTIDWIIITFMAFEYTATGHLGGFMDTALYQEDGLSNWLFRFVYHYILDWDGTIARAVLPHESFNPLTIRYTS
ncbi:MAG: LamG-like jellyroll fold domain-containing protein [Candidatus Hodarchaeales archaeon]